MLLFAMGAGLVTAAIFFIGYVIPDKSPVDCSKDPNIVVVFT